MTTSPTSALGQQMILSHIPVQPERSSRDKVANKASVVTVQQGKINQSIKAETSGSHGELQSGSPESMRADGLSEHAAAGTNRAASRPPSHAVM